MAETKKEAAEEKPAKAKGSLLDNKAVVLGVIVVAQVLVAIGLTQFVIVPKLGVTGAQMAAEGGQEAAAAEEGHGAGELVDLEEIIVTLKSDPGRPRYLRINVSLEVADKIAAEHASTRRPQLRDVVIMALSDTSVEDLSSPDGKQNLRDEIFRRMQERMPDGVLMNVYFSDLVIQ